MPALGEKEGKGRAGLRLPGASEGQVLRERKCDLSSREEEKEATEDFVVTASPEGLGFGALGVLFPSADPSAPRIPACIQEQPEQAAYYFIVMNLLYHDFSPLRHTIPWPLADSQNCTTVTQPNCRSLGYPPRRNHSPLRGLSLSPSFRAWQLCPRWSA